MDSPLEKAKVEALIGEDVLEFSISPGCTPEDGVGGSLKSISVKTVIGKELHLVLKEVDLVSPLMQKRIVDGTFKTENMVYSTLLPMLSQFEKSRGVDVQIPVPRVYDCYKGSNPLDDYICLEDVRFQGYKMTDKYAGLTLEETLLVMKEIGEYHALGYALIKWEGEKIFSGPLSTLVEYYNTEVVDGEVTNRLLREFTTSFQGAVNNGLELMEKRNPALHQKMKIYVEKTAAAGKYPQLQFGISFGTDLKYFPVIVHGDLWSNNIMFKYNPGGVPVSIKFLDFQLSRRGNIYEDLMYFLYTSTTPQFRRTHPLTPLQTYYESFIGMLKKLNVASPIGFTLGTFLDSVKENLPHVFRYMHFAIPLQLGTPLAQIARMAQEGAAQKGGNENEGADKAVAAQKMFIAVMRIQMETNEGAMDRLEALAQEMAELGVI